MMILKLRALKNIGSAFTVTVTSNFRTTCNWPLKLFVKYFENANPFKKKNTEKIPVKVDAKRRFYMELVQFLQLVSLLKQPCFVLISK